MKNGTIEVQGKEIGLLAVSGEDYISLTDIARCKDPDRTDYIIQNWIRSRTTIEFLGIWEKLNNPDFKPIEFDGFRIKAGLNSFVLTSKQWIEKTGAIGITSKSGRYGGTFAHKDIAFEFATWISVEFKLYLIKEFQRLKEEENRRLKLEWNVQRTISKINYRIHTDAIKENLIPCELSKYQVMLDRDLAELYGVETKVLNQAVKRNIGRFPINYRFQLNESEKNELVAKCDRLNTGEISLRSQIVTLENLRGRHSKYLPYAYTEHGVAMLAGVLKSQTAVSISISIVNAFIEMRKFLQLNAQIYQRLDRVELKQIETDSRIDQVFALMECGEAKFSAQYFPIEAEIFTLAHDRYIVIDHEKVYHVGASLKDLGKKWFAFSKIEKSDMEVISRLGHIVKGS